MIEAYEINKIEDLDGIRTAWHGLLAETPRASFFQTPEWLECYWKYFGGEQRLRVVVAADAGRMVGILPLVVRTEATRVGRVRVLTYPLHDWGTFYGPIGPACTETLSTGLRHVAHTPRDWDLLDLRWVDADGGDRGCTERAMHEATFRPMRQKWDQTSLVEFSDTWSDYWQSREPKFRKNLERLEFRIRAEGKVEYVRGRGTDAIDGKLYDTCVALSELSWQGREGDPTNLCHAAVSGYYRDAHAAADRLGAADVNLLYFDGQPAAFAYNYCWNGAVFGLRKGFDPQFARLRPGLVLQKLMLEDGHARGDRLYDFGTGDPDAKASWGTSTRASYRFTHFPLLDLRAQLLWCNRWIRRLVRGESDVACSQVV